ncbi:DUF6247 family protein [Microbispora sp. NBC_01189]|uniref:DUF6247 family protein n=1 Tax=Microbispora sp. NBC_01189 TaxID=2903583 RepID=UPI003A9512CE
MRAPAAIAEALPPAHRALFRAEYEDALDAAHDLARFKQVQTLLRQWRLRAIAYARPGYEEAVQDALQQRTEMFARYTPWVSCAAATSAVTRSRQGGG